MRKKISAEVRLIYAEQMSLYNFVILRKKQWTQMKTKQLKQDILTLCCIMLKNGQIYFKNLAVFTPQDF